MAVATAARPATGVICHVCRFDRAVVRSVLSDPLIVTVSTFVCADCQPINKAASDSLCAANPRLILTECAV